MEEICVWAFFTLGLREREEYGLWDSKNREERQVERGKKESEKKQC